jgi:hypothetical protein
LVKILQIANKQKVSTLFSKKLLKVNKMGMGGGAQELGLQCLFWWDSNLNRLFAEAVATTEIEMGIFNQIFLRGQRPFVPLLLLGPPFFPIILFLVHRPVNWDDRHLLAHAMASDVHSHMAVLSTFL